MFVVSLFVNLIYGVDDVYNILNSNAFVGTYHYCSFNFAVQGCMNISLKKFLANRILFSIILIVFIDINSDGLFRHRLAIARW